MFLQAQRVSKISGGTLDSVDEVKAEIVLSQDNLRTVERTTNSPLELASLVKTNIVERPVVVEKEVVKKRIESQINTEPIGTYKVTAFCNCALCSENKVSKDIMSNYKGINVASNPSEIPYGTKIWIDGVGIRQTQPSGQKLREKEIKVFFSTHEEVVSFNERVIEVYKILD